ncbi:Na+/H+ antiporter NhaC family protein [Haloprofundus sp. MHR1]|uniref:Na+/H+ antiporter NhaC family protein n=1 Tax=Haloprofundus sp. MHR1 TaxID=2572921 RepID=UPI0010BF31D7|nr:Na+/H+ antiporter NhaC family protein [Haloprofundus sp. MHR1]QCJ47322.1 arginine:ornithine antiporter [Haloprofundus sp. MHR1]
MASLSFEPLAYDDIPEDERPSLGQALVPVVGMLLFLSVGAIWLELDAHMPLLWGIVLTGLVGRFWYGISWQRMYEGVVDGLRMGMQAILILFVIYMLIATWTDAGTIPGLIYYGLELLSPDIFLPVTALLATGVAFAVGSSWTTAGTLGVAFIGIGSGLGVPAPMTAGAVLTGAYTGDKISPLSDTTNLASAVTNTDLYTHIRTMRVGTGIALLISLVLYSYLGLSATGSIPAGRVGEIQSAIVGAYSVNPVVFLPLVVTFGLALYGLPALPSLTAGVFAGALTSMVAQGRLSVEGFIHVWDVAQNGTAPETNVDLVNSLLDTGGLIGSSWTITIVVAALALGGLLERTGVLAVLAHHIGLLIVRVGTFSFSTVDRGPSVVRRPVNAVVEGVNTIISRVSALILGTAVSAFGMNVLAAEQYMSIVVPGMSLRGLYDEEGLDSRNLSRAVEAAGTTTSALIPWNAGGVYMAGVLGVPTLAYAPYYFLGFLSPLILVFMGVTGWRITYRDEETTAGIRGAVESIGDD